MEAGLFDFVIYIFKTCRLGTTQRPDSRSQSTPEPPLPQQAPSFGFSLFSRQLLSSDMFRALKGKDKDQQLSIRWEKLTEKERNEFNVEAEKVLLHWSSLYIYNSKLT